MDQGPVVPGAVQMEEKDGTCPPNKYKLQHKHRAKCAFKRKNTLPKQNKTLHYPIVSMGEGEREKEPHMTDISHVT